MRLKMTNYILSGRSLASTLQPSQQFGGVNDFSLSVLLQHEQVLIARDQDVRLGGRRQGKKIVIVLISTNAGDESSSEQFGSTQKVGKRIGVCWCDEVLNPGPMRDIDELVDSLRRCHEKKTSVLHGVCKLAPPPFNEGTNQDRGVEDRSDNGFSRRTSATSASIWPSSIDFPAVTLVSMRRQISRHRWAQVKRSMASATRSCSWTDSAFTWSTMDCVRESAMRPIIRGSDIIESKTSYV